MDHYLSKALFPQYPNQVAGVIPTIEGDGKLPQIDPISLNPATAAGIIHHIWTVQELLSYQVPLPPLEAAEAERKTIKAYSETHQPMDPMTMIKCRATQTEENRFYAVFVILHPIGVSYTQIKGNRQRKKIEIC